MAQGSRIVRSNDLSGDWRNFAHLVEGFARGQHITMTHDRPRVADPATLFRPGGRTMSDGKGGVR